MMVQVQVLMAFAQPEPLPSLRPLIPRATRKTIFTMHQSLTRRRYKRPSREITLPAKPQDGQIVGAAAATDQTTEEESEFKVSSEDGDASSGSTTKKSSSGPSDHSSSGSKSKEKVKTK